MAQASRFSVSVWTSTFISLASVFISASLRSARLFSLGSSSTCAAIFGARSMNFSTIGGTAYGLTEEDVEAEYLKPGPAGDRLRDGALDAYFFVGGYPTGAISELATSSGISLVPISGPEADKLLEDYGFFAKDVVPEGTYADVGETETISVAAQWVTSAEQPEELVYNIVKVMWNDATRKSLDAGHAKGKLDRKSTRLNSSHSCASRMPSSA